MICKTCNDTRILPGSPDLSGDAVTNAECPDCALIRVHRCASLGYRRIATRYRDPVDTTRALSDGSLVMTCRICGDLWLGRAAPPPPVKRYSPVDWTRPERWS